MRSVRHGKIIHLWTQIVHTCGLGDIGWHTYGVFLITIASYSDPALVENFACSSGFELRWLLLELDVIMLFANRWQIVNGTFISIAFALILHSVEHLVVHASVFWELVWGSWSQTEMIDYIRRALQYDERLLLASLWHHFITTLVVIDRLLVLVLLLLSWFRPRLLSFPV